MNIAAWIGLGALVGWMTCRAELSGDRRWVLALVAGIVIAIAGGWLSPWPEGESLGYGTLRLPAALVSLAFAAAALVLARACHRWIRR